MTTPRKKADPADMDDLIDERPSRQYTQRGNLKIDTQIYRRSRAQAVLQGITISAYINLALEEQIKRDEALQ